MSDALHVLLIDDDPQDAQHIGAHIVTGSSSPRCHHVSEPEGLELALRQQPWDVVLLEARLTRLDPSNVIAHLRAAQPLTPIIIVSRDLDAEHAVGFIQDGAVDYVNKNRLDRLPVTVALAREAAAAERLQRQADDELRATAERHGALLNGIEEVVYGGHLNEAGEPVITSMSARATELFGHPAEAILDDVSLWTAQIDQESLDRVIAAILAVLRTGKPEQVSYSLLHPGDDEANRRWFEATIVASNEPGQAHTSFYGSARDVTRHRHTERRLADILHHSTNLFYAESIDQTLVYASPQSEHFLGCAPADALRPWTTFLTDHPLNAAGLEAKRVAVATAVAQPSYELELETLQGERRWVRVNEAPVMEHGAEVSIVGSLTDITEQRAAEQHRIVVEETLRRSQRLESIGRLAGGIAHDFSNLLSVILSYSTFAMDMLPKDDELQEDLNEILKAGKRAATLTQQLVAFSRRQILTPSIIDLNAIVLDTSSMLRRVVDEDIRIDLLLDDELGRVSLDRGQLEQIMMNLVVNARDAMPDGGTLSIATRNAQIDGGETSAGAPPPGDYVVLEIRDTGQGMAPEVLDQIFEPFFTTKAAGIGTGLGLATVYGIVNQSRGTIEVTSTVGEGTRFTLFFPVATDSGEPRPSRPRALRGQGRTETILVVEDEEPVRLIVARSLRQAGYLVLVAETADEAALAVERHRGPLDLLLTDVVMPGSNGVLLAERLRHFNPSLRVLFMSGYSPEAVSSRGIPDGEFHFLAKPFTPDKLTSAVRKALRAP